MSLIKRYLVASAIPMSVIAFIFMVVLLEGEASLSMTAAVVTVILIGVAVLCTIGAFISRWMMHMGEKISNKGVRFFYYVLLLPVILILLQFAGGYINHLEDAERATYASVMDWGLTWEIGLKYFFLADSIALLLVLPYFQTIVVLVLGKLFPEKYSVKNSDVSNVI